MKLDRTLAAVAGLAIVAAGSLAFAQTPPAPVLGADKDTDSRPLPFGRRPHQPNDAPLGSGPFKAVMGEEPGLTAHTLYYPADLAKAGKLPVVAWGNGACINAGNRFRDFLTDIASTLWQVVPLTAAHLHHAQQLLVRHGLARRLRTLDAIQLAVAMALHTASPLDAFVCADANLGAIAAGEVLTVVNPETP